MNQPELIFILLFIAIMLICTQCIPILGQNGGGRREGQPCSNNLEPCNPGLQCYRNVCIVPRTPKDSLFGD